MIHVGANWKLNKSPSESAAFVRSLLAALEPKEESRVTVFPQTLCVEHACVTAKGSGVQIGVQNICHEAEGAFTGEVSAKVAKDIGCRYALIGHSERRQIFKEANENLAKKIPLALHYGLTPVFCVGETLEERNAGLTEKVLTTQLDEGLKSWDIKKSIVIAYEPVWAIGTGVVAQPKQVLGAHALIKSWLMTKSAELGHTPIWYGGSVKADNASELSKLENVNGFLVGGASLQVESLLAILRCDS